MWLLGFYRYVMKGGDGRDNDRIKVYVFVGKIGIIMDGLCLCLLCGGLNCGSMVGSKC